MDVAFHLGGPAQKSPELAALAPHKFPKFQKPDLRHLDAGVGLDAPQQIWAAPRSQAMTFGCVPEKAETMAHADIITAGAAPTMRKSTERSRFTSGRRDRPRNVLGA